jgi:hypothetical protein
MKTQTNDELRADHMRDIEEGKLRKNCRACGSLNIVLARKDGTEGKLTQTLIAVCSRQECHRYADIEQIPTWQRIRGGIQEN